MFAAVAVSILVGDSSDLGSSPTGVVGPECFSRGKRGLPSAGDLFDGSVLLLCTPDPAGDAKAAVMGLGTAPEWRERLEDVETFLRTPPYLRRLSAPALEDVEADRSMPPVLRVVVGDLPWGVGGPLSTCLTVPSSTAVPSIPIKK
jgi:hypothetical protein